MAAVFTAAGVGACLSGGGGSPPPLDQLNFPVGLAVSKGGGVLYVANADFDLQYGGGTVQSYDLNQIRRDALDVIAGDFEDCARVDAGADAGPSRHCLALVHGMPTGCPGAPADGQPDDAGVRIPLGHSCAPPVKAAEYVRGAVVIGAFATTAKLTPDGTRLFIPVRGTSALTWADVVPDDPTKPPTAASFGMSLAQIGLAPTWFLAKKLLEVAGPVATRRILLLGDPLPAARMAELGIIDSAVAPEELESAAGKIINRLANNAPLSLRAMKALLVREMAFREGIGHEDVDRLVEKARTSEDSREGIAARLEKRSPQFRGV